MNWLCFNMEPNNDGCVMFEQKDLFPQGLRVMEEIRRQGKFCDITLKVDGLSIRAHKIVLSATIPYFHAMFTVDMLESTEEEITLHEIEAKTLESLINFSYSGKIVIDCKTVASLMAGASYLQLTKVRDACVNFLSERLQACSVIGISKFADALSCSTLIEACEKYIQLYFYEVSLCEEFYNLSGKELMQLLSSDELHVSSEGEVFEALIRWVKQDPENRKEHLPHLLTEVRLPLISPEYLADKVANEELIKSSHACRDLVDEAKDYHLIPERRLLLKRHKTQPRSCGSVTHFVFAIGGLNKSGESVATVEMYDPKLHQWCLTEPMTTERSRVSVAVMNKLLYAVGGTNDSSRLNTVEVYDLDTKKWINVSPMHCQRSAGGAIVLKDRLYVCGGFDGTSSLNSVECYDPGMNVWSLVTEMINNRSSCGVVAFDGYIYALGGHNGLTIFNLVERYDPCTEKWTEVTPMLTNRCRLGVASLNGKLYACGGYDGSTFLKTVEVYDPTDNAWQMIKPMNTKRSRVALVVNMGKLWAIGGYDGVSNLSTVEIYDPKLDEWNFGPSMSAHEGGVGVGVVPIT